MMLILGGYYRAEAWARVAEMHITPANIGRDVPRPRPARGAGHGDFWAFSFGRYTIPGYGIPLLFPRNGTILAIL